MRRWIGSSNGASAGAIGARLREKKYIIKQQENYFLAEFPEEDVPLLSRELSAVAMEELLPQMLLNSFQNADPLLSPTELQTLAEKALTQLRKEGFLSRLRENLTELILRHLSESSVLSLEGLVFFRCRELFCPMEDLLTRLLQRHRTRKMLSTLREYVRQRQPRTVFLKVMDQGVNYLLYDGSGQRIIPAFSQKFTPEEELLNALLWFAPERLDLSQLHDPSLRSVLEEIFADRIIIP